MPIQEQATAFRLRRVIAIRREGPASGAKLPLGDDTLRQLVSVSHSGAGQIDHAGGDHGPTVLVGRKDIQGGARFLEGPAILSVASASNGCFAEK
jgi:hypothetical protein